MEQLWEAEAEAQAQTAAPESLPLPQPQGHAGRPGLDASFGQRKATQDALTTIAAEGDARRRRDIASAKDHSSKVKIPGLGTSLGPGSSFGADPAKPPLDLMHFVVELETDAEIDGSADAGAANDAGGAATAHVAVTAAKSTDHPQPQPQPGGTTAGPLGGLAGAAARLKADACASSAGAPTATSAGTSAANATAAVSAAASKPNGVVSSSAAGNASAAAAALSRVGVSGLSMGASFSALRTGVSAPGRAVTSDAVVALIRFLYGEAPTMTTDNVPALLAAASYLDVPQLAVRAADFVFSHLTVENGELAASCVMRWRADPVLPVCVYIHLPSTCRLVVCLLSSHLPPRLPPHLPPPSRLQPCPSLTWCMDWSWELAASSSRMPHWHLSSAMPSTWLHAAWLPCRWKYKNGY